MKLFKKTTLATSLALIISPMSVAGTDIFFTPLTQTETVTAVDSIEEKTSAFTTPAGVTAKMLTSLGKIEADPLNQSIVRVPGLGQNASMWDMLAFDKRGENIFIPHETQWGAGVSRYNIATDKSVVLFAGDNQGAKGNWSADWGAFDPATLTPNGTLIVAEEWSGLGSAMEVMNPMAAPKDIVVRELTGIPSVAHEGLRFSANGKTIYFVDEWNSGSIYKIVLKDKKNYAKGGQTFVLSVNDFKGNPAADYNMAGNDTQPRVGLATWVPITDANGNKLTLADPFLKGPSISNISRGGRAAADEVNGTPYGRPEDLEVGELANGNQVLYFSATAEKSVYSVEMEGKSKAIVRLFVGPNTPKNLGFPATNATLNSPDNLAQDALGNIFVVEDAPNGGAGAKDGDTWFARDVDGDGVAESLDHFMSIRVQGAETTGMIFNPRKKTNFVSAVQHPASTAVAGGTGDALWSFDLSGVVPPSYCSQPGNETNTGCNYVKLLQAE